MRILGIETSCDETGAAVVEDGQHITGQALASSVDIQRQYGGVVPEQAAREQLKSILPVIDSALKQAGDSGAVDSIAVTVGPGLVGSLLIGVETAKTLAWVWNKPLIPVNHLLAHFYAAWIDSTPPAFPFIGLLISGGHTDLILMKDHGVWEYLGGTRDDAAGEAFDKTARLLGLPYPGGAALAQLARRGDSKQIVLPSPMRKSENYDFSFSGLKTAAVRLIDTLKPLKESTRANIAACLQETIVEVLVAKTVRAIETYRVPTVIVAGGVAANERLREVLRETLINHKLSVDLHIPPPGLCTDNAVMIAACAYYLNRPVPIEQVQADPSISLR